MLGNDKTPTNLSLVFFHVDKKLKKKELNFIFPLHNSMGSLPIPGDILLSFNQTVLLLLKIRSDKLAVSQLCIYNQEVFLTWIIFANYN